MRNLKEPSFSAPDSWLAQLQELGCGEELAHRFHVAQADKVRGTGTIGSAKTRRDDASAGSRQQLGGPSTFISPAGCQPDRHRATHRSQIIDVPVQGRAAPQVTPHASRESSRPPRASYIDVESSGKPPPAQCTDLDEDLFREHQAQGVNPRTRGQDFMRRCHSILPSQVRITPRVAEKRPRTSIRWMAWSGPSRQMSSPS